MSQFFQIHPENPQPRLVKQAVEIVRQGGVIVYPTDSSYALGCRIGEKTAVDRIRRIRQLDDKHNFTLVCRDLSELGVYAKVDTGLFRLLKAHTPGPYTFILSATREAPAPQAPHHRPARAELSDRPGAAGGTGRTADEREPDHARQRRATERSL